MTVSQKLYARNVLGDTSGTAVPAGYVGEEQIASTGQTTITSSGVAQTFVTLTLQPGNWVISGGVAFNGTSTNITSIYASINTSGTPTNDYNSYCSGANNVNIAVPGGAIPTQTVNITVATTYKLCANVLWSTGTVTCYGKILAIRK